MGVVALGLAVLDVVQRVQTPPAWGTKGVADSVEITAGGPATNAAIACAATGVETTLVTALGRSPQASLVRAECDRHGVRVIDLAGRGDAWELPVASCIVDAEGERTVVSTGALATTLALTVEAEAALAAARVLLLDGHHPRAAAKAVAVRPASCLAVLDAGSAKPHAEEWLPWLDVVAGSADYAAGLARLPGAHASEGEDATGHDTARLLQRALDHVLAAGAGAVVMTDGAAPVHWATREGERASHTPTQVRAVDTLGAGDAWHGAFAAALAHDLSLPQAIAYACNAASTRVAHEGARTWLGHMPPLSRPSL